MEEGIHLHCLSCINIKKCSASAQRSFKCPITSCHLACGSIFHECKKAEHQLLCQNERVPCYNESYGCPCQMQRKYLAKHLKVCPASVIHCTMEWNRQYINPKGVKMLQKCLDVLQNQPQLDIALALRDQRTLPVGTYSAINNGHGKMSCVEGNDEMSDNDVQQNWWNNGYNSNFYNSLYHRFKVFKSKMNCLAQNISPDRATQNNPIETNDNEENKENLDIYTNNHGSDQTHCDIPEECLTQYKNCNKVIKGEEEGGKTLSFSEPIVRAITSSPTRYLGLGANCGLWLHRSLEPILTFLCCQEFRRDEYPWHYKNVHSEIYGGLNGWLQERCPLAQYGCTFSRKRLNPKPEGLTIVYNKIIESIGVTSNLNAPECQSTLEQNSNESFDNYADGKSTFQSIHLSQLPFEVLKHMAQFLDSFSLSNLALTSCLMREVCQSLLVDHGIVALKWEKQFGNDSVSWKVTKKKWFFSSHFAPIKEWAFDDSSNMSNHLKTCVYFNRNKKTDPYYYPMGIKPNECVYQKLKEGVDKMGIPSENVSTKL